MPNGNLRRGGQATLRSVVAALVLAGCASTPVALRRQLDAGNPDQVISEGTGWLAKQAGRPTGEQEEVLRVVAEARLAVARRAGTPEALDTFRAAHADPRFADLERQARDLAAAAAWRRQAGKPSTLAWLRDFEARYPGTQESGQARALELGLASAQAEAARSPAAERALRERYADWPDATPELARSRDRELALALGEARRRGEVRAFQAFQAEYAAWPGAGPALAEARRLEAAAALEAAGADLAALREVAERYPEPPWPDRAAERQAGARLAPIRSALQRGAAPDDAAVDELLSDGEPLEPLRGPAASLEAPLLQAARRAGRAAPYRLYLALFPEGAGAAQALAFARDLAWAEAERQATPEAWRAFADAHPEDARAGRAEAAAVTLDRLAAAGRGGPRAEVTGRRLLPGGEVELTLDVWRCGERVAGLRQQAFELSLGAAPLPITRFLSLEDDRPLQLVFAFDLSGSMAPEREAVRRAVALFAETFRFRGRRAAIGLVTFGDELRDVHAPTTQVAEFRRWIEAPKLTEGGAAEDDVGALLAASELLSRADAERVVVLLTDEPLQVNLSGLLALGRAVPACERTARATGEFLRCGDDLACRARSLRAVVPDPGPLYLSCVRVRGPLACAKGMGTLLLGEALARCTGVDRTGVEEGSPPHRTLRDTLARRAVRPFLILPHEQARAEPFTALARPLDGAIFPVEDDSQDPATFTAPLLALADQLSKQYVVRYRPPPGRAAEPPQVLVRLGHDFTAFGTTAGALSTLVALAAGRPDCPELAALALDGRLLRSAACGQRFEPWRPGGLERADQLAAAAGGGAWLVAGGRLLLATPGGVADPVATGLERVDAVVVAHDGAAWAVGASSAGAAALARRAADEERFHAVPFPGLEVAPLALWPQGGEAACALLPGARLRCRGATGAVSERPATAGRPAARLTGRPADALALPGRAGGWLWVTADGAVLRTTDGGGLLREVLPPSTPGWRLAALPGGSGMVCAATPRQTRCSEDQGFSWFEAGHDVEAGAKGAAIAGAGGRIYLDRGGRLLRLATVLNRDVPSTAVYFDTDRDVPAPSIRPFLDHLGRLLARDPRLVLRVEGHADVRGGDAHNDDLSRRRAEAVGRRVLSNGAAPGQLEVASFGSRRPVRPGGSPDDLARNRRVELVLMEPVTLPAAADLAPCPAPDASPELPEFAPADELEEADEAEEVQ